MIKNFKSDELELIFDGEYSAKFPQEIQRRILQKLMLIDAAVSLEDLRVPPSNRLETTWRSQNSI